MREPTASGDKRMTVREVAEALGVSIDTVYNSIKEIESQSEENRFGKVQGSHGGKPYYVLDEAQVTAVKMNLRKNSEVAAQPKTRLEKALLIQQAMQFQNELVEELQKENVALKAENVVLKPKAEYHDRLVDAKGLTNFRDTAKELGIPEKKFISILLQKKYVYRDKSGDLRPYAEHMKWFALKDWESGGHSGVQVRITVAGKRHFLSLFGCVIADSSLFL
jgi:phage antirepressor YoqD-like protein